MKHKERKLARLILGALMATSSVLFAPGVAMATETIVDDARVTTDDAENQAIYGNNNGNIKNYNGPTASGNTITVETTKTLEYVYGASTDGDAATNENTVRISSGTVTASVIGGSSAGDAKDNQVYISGTASVQQNVAGGNATTESSGNLVEISGGEVGGRVTGASSTNADATDNQVIVKGGTVTGDVCGGRAQKENATGNTVTIESGTVGGAVIGGSGLNYGGTAGTGNATGNKVIVKGGTIGLNVTGGLVYNGTASGNIVNLYGGTITGGMVTGGMAQGDGNATDNTVNVLAAMTLQGIIGGTVFGAGTSSNNTVNIAAPVTLTDNIYGVQNLNFYLPEGAKAKPMLTINGGFATDFTMYDTTIGVAAQTGANLEKGDKVTLIKNDAGFTGTAKTTTLTTVPEATSLTVDTTYKFAIDQETTEIIATVTEKEEKKNDERSDPETTPTKSLLETRAATTTFINAGADMLASQGFAQAANAVALEMAGNAANGGGDKSGGGFTPFAAFGGAGFRAESGSYVDTRGFGLNVGFARELPNSQGKLLFGPVVEYGGGSYDSYLEDANNTHGEGGAHYFGVGIMARQVNHDGFYYEGSVRGGRVTSDYESNDIITTPTRQKVEYDSSSNYWAAHLGIGKAMNVGGSNTLDAYLRYFYSHQAGDDATVKLDGVDIDRASFDAVNSNRIRIGARLTHKVNEMNSFYGGLAYQYEFSGEARAHFQDGTSPASPSVKGSSGMLELGWQVKPGNGPMTLDLGVTGWAGKQRGGSVQLGATWTF